MLLLINLVLTNPESVWTVLIFIASEIGVSAKEFELLNCDVFEHETIKIAK